MNVVCVLLDGLNRHFLSSYGEPPAETPNLERLTKQSPPDQLERLGLA